MRTLGSALLLFLLTLSAVATSPGVEFSPSPGSLALASDGRPIPLVVATTENPGVLRAARDLQADFERVTGTAPTLVETVEAVPAPTAILVGTLGSSPLIDGLVATGKIHVDDVAGRWEAFLHEIVDHPAPGIDRALVIAGSDRRGTIFGLYTLSEQIGVSPWYWWADVPTEPHPSIHCLPGRRVEAPVVQYRGIFLNDEAPALANWAQEKFGGINSKMYVHVFELLLRLRANYLWPAMWDNAFNDDDPESPRLADEYGIVMGTSHHEPMIRAHKEWARYGRGPWNYATNEAVLRAFWREGIEQRGQYENIVTLAMRGDGDEAMSEETNTALLERIVADQREIIEEVTGRPAEETPQLWALYKEVQSYYEHGMRVPDDVILLWCDDNWGNIRRLPTPEEQVRPGGAGVYYHFDYVGGPRCYKWINVRPLTKVWEQMNLAHQYKADRIWIVNVGDLKPMELPIDFFLEMAWDPEALPYDRVDDFTREFAAQSFGPEHAEEIATLLDGYTHLNGLRTPEMLAPDTFSLVNYREAEHVSKKWDALVALAEQIGADLPESAQDAYYQLVLYPVKASATVFRLYLAAGRNHLYALQGRAEAQDQADLATALFALDQALAERYHELGGGRWNHQMDQINLGYTYWQQPPIEVMPAVQNVRPQAGSVAGLAIEGSKTGWPVWGAPRPKLPPLTIFGRESRWLEVFNRGDTPFTIEVSTDQPWLQVSEATTLVEGTTRLWVSADWSSVPLGESVGHVTIEGGGQRFSVEVPVVNPAAPRPEDLSGFVETDGVVAIEAQHYSRALARDGISWMTLEDYGRTLGGVTILPVTAAERAPGGDGPRLEYDFYSFHGGEQAVTFHLSPSLDFQSGEGLRFAVSVDDGPLQVLALDTWDHWNEAVGQSIRKVSTQVDLGTAGAHTLKVWMVTPGVVFQRIVINFGGLRPSYLGPTESPRF